MAGHEFRIVEPCNSASNFFGQSHRQSAHREAGRGLRGPKEVPPILHAHMKDAYLPATSTQSPGLAFGQDEPAPNGLNALFIE